jgi:hypothetical protein
VDRVFEGGNFSTENPLLMGAGQNSEGDTKRQGLGATVSQRVWEAVPISPLGCAEEKGQASRSSLQLVTPTAVSPMAASRQLHAQHEVFPEAVGQRAEHTSHGERGLTSGTGRGSERGSADEQGVVQRTRNSEASGALFSGSVGESALRLGREPGLRTGALPNAVDDVRERGGLEDGAMVLGDTAVAPTLSVRAPLSPYTQPPSVQSASSEHHSFVVISPLAQQRQAIIAAAAASPFEEQKPMVALSPFELREPSSVAATPQRVEASLEGETRPGSGVPDGKAPTSPIVYVPSVLEFSMRRSDVLSSEKEKDAFSSSLVRAKRLDFTVVNPMTKY